MDSSTKNKMSLSPAELVAEMSMIDKEYLVVEGESDKLFWEHMQLEGLKKRSIMLANKKECSGNKEYVKEVIIKMNERGKKNVVGIIDLDYDFVKNKKEEINNLFYYKYIDLENILIQSSSFSEVNKFISSKNKKITDEKLREKLYENSYILGLLRLINDIEKYNLSFENLDYKKILNVTNQARLDYFMSHSHLTKEQKLEISTKVLELSKKDYEVSYICNGHDLINILSLLTKKEIATDNPIQYNPEILEKMLILGYRKTAPSTDVVECTDIILNSKI